MLTVVAVSPIAILSTLLSCFTTSVHCRDSLGQNDSRLHGSRVDQTASMMDPKLFSEHRRRGVPLVDTAAIPSTECAFNDCNNPQPPSDSIFSSYSTPLIPQCPLVRVPCRPDESGYAKCYSWHLDCFCDAPAPLWCAWDCNWDRWFGVEDWFSKACPHTPPVDFSPLPTCARSCISEATFNYGCITGSSSCFCLHEDLFDCPAQCQDPADLQRITDWYQNTCRWPSDTTASIVNAGKSSVDQSSPQEKQGAVIQAVQPTKLHWYEILIIITAILTVVAAALCTIVICLLKKAPKFQKKRLDHYTLVTGGIDDSEVIDWRQPRA